MKDLYGICVRGDVLRRYKRLGVLKREKSRGRASKPPRHASSAVGRLRWVRCGELQGAGDLSSTRDCLEKDVVQFVFTGWSRGWQGRLVCFVGGFGTLKY